MSSQKVLVSGGTGFVGRFIVEAFLGQGGDVVVASRIAPRADFFSQRMHHAPLVLGEVPQAALLEGVDCFIHAAFDHLPGKYRGGEGGDPASFCRRNLDGSVALFEAAKAAGVRTVVFLSSRAVYGFQPAGALLTEQTEPHPDTLYGEVKLAAERHLLSMAGPDFRPVVLRVTGVYGPAGPGRDHKWSDLIRDYIAGRPIVPRVATEVHGDDVANAVRLVCETGAGGVFNVSDLLVDRHDLLRIVRDTVQYLEGTARASGGEFGPLPARADPSGLNVMSTEKLRALGWRPGGQVLFEKTVREMMRARTA